MKVCLVCFSLSVLMALTSCGVEYASANDATLQPNTGGCDVIEAVLIKINAAGIFSEDNGFLRRVAYAETRAGQTLASKGNGPWAVTEEMLQATQSDSTSSSADYAFLQPLRHLIWNSTQLRGLSQAPIRWRNVTFDQLRLPLYSALASRLYLHLLTSRSGSSQISLRLDSQALFWSKNFLASSSAMQPGLEDMRTWTFINRTRQLDDQCACAANVDMTFVLDMSGSVKIWGFRQATRFAANIASSFRIGQNATRIALITYSTVPVLNFDLAAHNSSQQVTSAIRSAPFVGQHTNTAAALYKMIRNVFRLNVTSPVSSPPPPVPTTPRPTTAAPTTPPRFVGPVPDFGGGGGEIGGIEPRPATPGMPTVPPTVAPVQLRTRVGIVITDGKAQDDVGPPSRLAHDLGITLFSIGVGRPDRRELNLIASDPDQAHVYYVGDYSIIENIRTSIRQRSCLTSAPLDLDQPVMGSLGGNETQFIAVPLPPGDPTVTIMVSASSGDLEIFGSYSYPNPSAALNEFRASVEEGKTEHFVLSPDSVSSTRRKRQATSATNPSTLYLSVQGKSDSNQFLLQAQSGNVAPTLPAPTQSALSGAERMTSSGLLLSLPSMVAALLIGMFMH